MAYGTASGATLIPSARSYASVRNPQNRYPARSDQQERRLQASRQAIKTRQLAFRPLRPPVFARAPLKPQTTENERKTRSPVPEHSSYTKTGCIGRLRVVAVVSAGSAQPLEHNCDALHLRCSAPRLKCTADPGQSLNDANGCAGVLPAAQPKED